MDIALTPLPQLDLNSMKNAMDTSSSIQNETKQGNKYIPVTIISVPSTDDSKEYLVQEKDLREIHSLNTEAIMDADPSADSTEFTTTEPPPSLHPWKQTQQQNDTVFE
eukprot:5412159-Ditylum_brightwellii.AAC.1